MNIVEELLKVALLGSAWVLYLLLALSVISLGVMAERWWFFQRNARRGGEALRESVLRGVSADDAAGVERALRESGTVEGEIVANALAFREGGGEALSAALDAELSRARRDLERGMNFLGTIGNNAPFIGLLGTVIGVIGAFEELGSESARQGAMGNVMAAIAEALVATGVGLFVALPAVIAFNVATKRIGDIEQEALSLGRLLSAWLTTRARGGAIHLPSPTPARTAPLTAVAVAEGE